MRIDVKEELWASKSSRLKNKRILFLITGSVAMYKTVDMIREIIRQGADVKTMLSPAAQQMIGEMIFEWASGNPVITKITGKVEHVLMVGDNSQKVNLVIVAPITANTLGKAAHGIADTNVSLTLMTALGNNIKILLVPGMHAPMHNNPHVQKNIKILTQNPNVTWLKPNIIESKAKIPSLFSVIRWTIRLLSPQLLLNQKILVTAGPTREFIDKIRYISNPSTGKMGFAFAIEAWYLGAQIFFIAGPNQLQIPPEFSIKLVTSVNDMSQAVEQILVEEKPSFAIFSAAVADYQPKEIVDEKIRSGQSEMVIELKPTIKILKLVQTIKSKKDLKIKIIAFKAEYGKSIDEISKIASTYIFDGLADFVIANEVGPVKKGFAVDQTKVLIFSSASNPKVIPASKLEIAYDVWNSILNMPFD